MRGKNLGGDKALVARSPQTAQEGRQVDFAETGQEPLAVTRTGRANTDRGIVDVNVNDPAVAERCDLRLGNSVV